AGGSVRYLATPAPTAVGTDPTLRSCPAPVAPWLQLAPRRTDRPRTPPGLSHSARRSRHCASCTRTLVRPFLPADPHNCRSRLREAGVGGTSPPPPARG